MTYRPSGRRAADIAADVEAAVAAGRAPTGTLLPPVRTLATDLGVAAGTVAAAYRLLTERGVVEANRRAGTRIRPRPETAEVRGRQAPLPPGTRDLARGNPDPALLPTTQLTLTPRLYGETPVLPELEAAARAAFEADGIPAPTIAITSGAMDAVERAIAAHLRPGMRVAVEDPGYAGVLDLLDLCGLVAEPVAIDDQGMRPEALDTALAAGAQAVIITPRAQNPTGAALTRQRATELKKLLDRAPELLVIEDDHAGPVAGAPAVSVVEGRRGLTIRSFSKSLGPDLRVAAVTGHPAVIAAVEARQAAGVGWVSHLLQQAVVRLLTTTDAETAAQAYEQRRRLLIEELAERGTAATGRTGLNVWVPVPDEGAVVAGMAARGWAISAGARYRIASPPAVRITIATLADPDERRRVADDLAASIGRPGRARVG